jgi:hypothetical protein
MQSAATSAFNLQSRNIGALGFAQTRREPSQVVERADGLGFEAEDRQRLSDVGTSHEMGVR